MLGLLIMKVDVVARRVLEKNVVEPAESRRHSLKLNKVLGNLPP
jgi:hypothetical protein